MFSLQRGGTKKYRSKICRICEKANRGFSERKNNRKSIPDLTLAQCIYWAGFFDGEGSISIARRKRTKSNWYIVVNITNTNESIIDSFCEECAASKYTWDYSNSRWKRRFDGRLSCHQALTFLNQIYPYLRIKKDQVRYAILGMETYSIGTHYTPKDIAKRRIKYFLKISSLNKKGRDEYSYKEVEGRFS